ncbi:unnamed protein product [Mycena citricolor]|uniref:RTA1-domain-containing protein n=1 Tax=Mycena citricolor TaxID=2018698 RepID=A0AAD2K6W0_9AGAR|nr:unnamed protein product [Mycena citricolor]
MIPTAVLCGLLEIVGWGARLKSSFDPTVLLAFEIQTIGTIIGPTPLIAADFMILGRIIQRLGIQYSRLSPKLYSIIFCSFDIVSLTVQGFGATKASLAVHNGTSTKSGANIMLIGIIFQMVTITIYILLATEFLLRYFKDWPIGGKQAEYHELSGGLITSSPLGERSDGRGNFDYPMQIVVGALTFNTACLFIRAIYRTVELLDGFGGPIISTQRYFNILDGCMIALAITTLNVVHPGVWLKKHDKKESEIEGRLKQAGLLYYRM